MSLLFRVLFAQKCKSTHHKLAMDALRLLECAHAEEWRNLFLANIECYLDGSKAPDTKFRDFRNHVLHVQDNYWGGAVVQVEKWYERTVNVLREGDWQKAVYAAGVLSHYYTDPLMPLHTGQSEREGAVHRAMEWSVAKSYEILQNILVEDLGGYPDVAVPEGADWLALMTIDGATAANRHYEILIDHYNFEQGKKDPPAGLDQESKDRLAMLLGHAAVGFARILERAIAESQAHPPGARISLAGHLARLTVPVFWITRKLSDRTDRRVVAAMYRELTETGRVLRTLPDDDRDVRARHAAEVLKVDLKVLDRQTPQATGTKYGEGAKARDGSARPMLTPPAASRSKSATGGTRPDDRPKDRRADWKSAASSVTTDPVDDAGSERRPAFHLELDSPIVDAPSIGPKTARRLKRLRIRTVQDLLDLDPTDAASELRVRYITPELLRDWQDQSRLIYRIPGIRGHDAQILVGCDIRDPDQLASLNADDLMSRVGAFVDSAEGERVIRSGQRPDAREISHWIEWAGQARRLRAA